MVNVKKMLFKNILIFRTQKYIFVKKMGRRDFKKNNIKFPYRKFFLTILVKKCSICRTLNLKRGDAAETEKVTCAEAHRVNDISIKRCFNPNHRQYSICVLCNHLFSRGIKSVNYNAFRLHVRKHHHKSTIDIFGNPRREVNQSSFDQYVELLSSRARYVCLLDVLYNQHKKMKEIQEHISQLEKELKIKNYTLKDLTDMKNKVYDHFNPKIRKVQRSLGVKMKKVKKHKKSKK